MRESDARSLSISAGDLTRPTLDPDDAVSAFGSYSEVAQLLTATDLAERWQIEKATVYAHTRAGSIPAVRIGRLYRYRLDAIEQYERNGGGRSDE
ncbi:MAG: helix-turn-helix domain-containing protein [Solirubrobacterales bacterium]|nr:helix-turn-helix domain-containing protein [Solirubrobacterales bacterium]